ncbi:hypothetical protein [Clostridium sp.]
MKNKKLVQLWNDFRELDTPLMSTLSFDELKEYYSSGEYKHTL